MPVSSVSVFSRLAALADLAGGHDQAAGNVVSHRDARVDQRQFAQHRATSSWVGCIRAQW